jgi:hypothetical protein
MNDIEEVRSIEFIGINAGSFCSNFVYKGKLSRRVYAEDAVNDIVCQHLEP